MTQAELEQLSRDVAEKYGIAPTSTVHQLIKEPYTVWLHDDIGRCATLAIEHDIGVAPRQHDCQAFYGEVSLKTYTEKNVYYAEHNNNKIRATCVAILKALKDKP